MLVIEKIYWRIIGWLGKFLVWFLGVSARKTILGEKSYLQIRKKGRPVIFVLWHGRILFTSYFFRKRSIHALVSPSRDGEIIAQILSRWGYRLLRGSGSHSVVKEWKNMKRLLARGGELILVADGPKGPARNMKPGALRLAQDTGAYIIPFAFSAKKKKFLKSWDRFLLFYPFTKLVAAFGEPFKVKPDLNPKEFERERKRIERDLTELEKKTDRFF